MSSHDNEWGLSNRMVDTAVAMGQLHSLSYQDITRTSVPSITLVWSRWTIEERASWLKSIETFGRSVTPRMPLSCCSAARLTAVLISSTEVARLATIFRSNTDPLGPGTRLP